MSRWAAIRCVVFDFDGTLVESNPIKRNTYFEILADTPGSRAVVETVLARSPGLDRHGVLACVHEELSEQGAEPLPAQQELVESYSRTCEERVAECAPLPGALDTLAELRATHALYLDSATPGDALARVVQRRGWSEYFRGVRGGPASKLANLQWIAAREGIGSGEILYVGDGAADRDAAEHFGCWFLGFEAPPYELPEGSPLVRLVAEIAVRSAL